VQNKAKTKTVQMNEYKSLGLRCTCKRSLIKTHVILYMMSNYQKNYPATP